MQNYLDGLSLAERGAIADFLAVGVVGGPARVRAGLAALAEATRADEFMLVSDLFDPERRLASLEITARAMDLPAATIAA